MARTAIQNYLDNVHIEIFPDYRYFTVSCKQIAELRPSYDSGYYWIQGVSGAVGVYCEMGTNNKHWNKIEIFVQRKTLGNVEDRAEFPKLYTKFRSILHISYSFPLYKISILFQ